MIRAEWTPREAHQELDQDSDLSDDGPPAPSAPPIATSIDTFTSSMTSLSLVIRFGRGGKNGGFVHPSGYPAHPTPTDHRHGHSATARTPDSSGLPRTLRLRRYLRRIGTRRRRSIKTLSEGLAPVRSYNVRSRLGLFAGAPILTRRLR
jgi:hypothetical protein